MNHQFVQKPRSMVSASIAGVECEWCESKILMRFKLVPGNKSMVSYESLEVRPSAEGLKIYNERNNITVQEDAQHEER
jgi:hypothetical protein